MNCTTAGELFEFRDDDVGMAVLPMFHVFGLSSVLNVTVRFGGSLVLVPRFDPKTVIEELALRRCTIFSGVPTRYFALLQADTEGHDLSAVRVGVSGGGAIPGEVIRAFEEKFPGVVVFEAAYKYPREVRVIDELPTGPTGKVLTKDCARNVGSVPAERLTARRGQRHWRRDQRL